jgi:anti-sigma factor RsiW
MNCKQCEDNLSSYADGALPKRYRSAIKAHLEVCISCSLQLEELLALKRLLGLARSPEARMGFWYSAVSRAVTDAAARRRSTRRAMPLCIAGTACLLFVVYAVTSRAPTGDYVVETRMPRPAATFDPSTLISLHATMRATRPLADTGKIRFAISEGNARDYANDAALGSL